MHNRKLLLSLVFAALVFTVSCESDDQIPGGCSGAVNSATQVGNNINITGSFSQGQPIIRLTRNGVNNEIPAATYDNGTASFGIGGVAKGQYTLTWILSCFNDQGEVVMTSSITSITIT